MKIKHTLLISFVFVLLTPFVVTHAQSAGTAGQWKCVNGVVKNIPLVYNLPQVTPNCNDNGLVELDMNPGIKFTIATTDSPEACSPTGNVTLCKITSVTFPAQQLSASSDNTKISLSWTSVPSGTAHAYVYRSTNSS